MRRTLQPRSFEVEPEQDVFAKPRESAEVYRQRFAELYDFAPVAYCILDAAASIVEINFAGAQLFDRPRASLVKKPILVLVESIDYPSLSSHLRRCFDSRERDRFELNMTVRGGHPLTLDVQTSPLIDDAGKPSACLMVLVDITRQKDAERATDFLIKLTKELSSRLVSTDALAFVAKALVPFPASASFANAYKLVTPALEDGFTHADPAKSPLLQNLVGRRALLPSVKQGLEQVRRMGKPVLIPFLSPADRRLLEIDRSLRSWTETLHLASFAILPLFVREDTVGTLCLGRTSYEPPFGESELPFLKEVALRCSVSLENMQLYETALRAARVRDECVAMISHDLSNAVSALLLTVPPLAKSGPEQERRQHGGRADWLRVERTTRWMQRLMQRLLDISVIESGSFSIDPKVEAADDLITSTIEMLEVVAAAKNILLKKEVPAGVRVVADKERIQQVLSNLVANAIKFSPERTTITLRVEEGTRVSFSVIDQGPGISSEDQKRIFDRFWQAKRARKGGAGLGLAIARGIVRAHGGELWVESELARGSAFRFTLANGVSALATLPSRDPRAR